MVLHEIKFRRRDISWFGQVKWNSIQGACLICWKFKEKELSGIFDSHVRLIVKFSSKNELCRVIVPLFSFFLFSLSFSPENKHFPSFSSRLSFAPYYFTWCYYLPPSPEPFFNSSLYPALIPPSTLSYFLLIANFFATLLFVSKHGDQMRSDKISGCYLLPTLKN